MKLSEAIALMEKQKAKYGDVEVFFDCPNCEYSFAPSTAKAVALHVTNKPMHRQREAIDAAKAGR